MYCIVLPTTKSPFWNVFTNEVWQTRKEAEEYAKRNKFKKSIKWKVIWYNKKYHS
jgi:hypothetical protein|tara:strand:+ start:465 stop:629 length:165 start_codon:yes stop_codon:yes gene_type:complete